MSMPAHVWTASAKDADAAAALLIEFRDWWGYDKPADEVMRGAVETLVRDPATDYLLGAPEPGAPPCGICQLRYRLSVWTGGDECWLEDLYVRDDARRSGVGRALVEAGVERASARLPPHRARRERTEHRRDRLLRQRWVQHRAEAARKDAVHLSAPRALSRRRDPRAATLNSRTLERVRRFRVDDYGGNLEEDDLEACCVRGDAGARG